MYCNCALHMVYYSQEVRERQTNPNHKIFYTICNANKYYKEN